MTSSVRTYIDIFPPQVELKAEESVETLTSVPVENYLHCAQSDLARWIDAKLAERRGKQQVEKAFKDGKLIIALANGMKGADVPELDLPYFFSKHLGRAPEKHWRYFACGSSGLLKVFNGSCI